LLIPRIAKQIPQSCLRLAVEVTVSCQFWWCHINVYRIININDFGWKYKSEHISE
jgi:hypothetical protein